MRPGPASDSGGSLPARGLPVETPRLTLRPFETGDALPLAREADHPEVARTLRDRFPHPYTLEHARAWIALRAPESPPTALAIVRREDARLLGGVGVDRLADVARLTGEIGYWLGPEHWGRGYAREATAAFVAYLFEAFDFERLEAWTFAPNLASRRVLEACGFRLEGIARRSVVKNGEVMDSCLYALLRGEAVAPTVG